jgi:putative nucleotidyltransferase with HDIG domain
MTREECWTCVEANVESPNLRKHMLATEAVMRALARRLGHDEQEWGLAGLLHDLDVELTKDEPHTHGLLSADVARELGATETQARAIVCHNEAHGVARTTPLDHALWAADPLTGLVTAGALVHPEKRLGAVTAESLLKRFREKRFAAGASREQIASCGQLGLSLEQFVTTGLGAMQAIAPDLGL